MGKLTISKYVLKEVLLIQKSVNAYLSTLFQLSQIPNQTSHNLDFERHGNHENGFDVNMPMADEVTVELKS